MFFSSRTIQRAALLAGLLLLIGVPGLQPDELKTLTSADGTAAIAGQLLEAQRKRHLMTGRYADSLAELAGQGFSPPPAGLRLIIETWPNEAGPGQEFRSLVYDPDKKSLVMYDSAVGGFIAPPSDPAEIALHLRRYLKIVAEAQNSYFKKNKRYTDDLSRLLPFIYNHTRPPLYLRLFTALEFIDASNPAAGFVATAQSPDGRLVAVFDSSHPASDRIFTPPPPGQPRSFPGYLAFSCGSVELEEGPSLTGRTILAAGTASSSETGLARPRELPATASGPFDHSPGFNKDTESLGKPPYPAATQSLKPMLAFLKEAQAFFFLQKGVYAEKLEPLAALKPDQQIEISLKLVKGPGNRPGYCFTAQAAPENWTEIYDSLRGGPLTPALHSPDGRRQRYQARLTLGWLSQGFLSAHPDRQRLEPPPEANAWSGLTIQEAPNQRPGFLVSTPGAGGRSQRYALSLELIPGPLKGPGFVLAATDLESGQTEIFNNLSDLAAPLAAKALPAASPTKALVDYLASRLEGYFVEYGYYPEDLAGLNEALLFSGRPLKAVEMRARPGQKNIYDVVIYNPDGSRALFQLKEEPSKPSALEKNGRIMTLISPDQRWAESFAGAFRTLDLSGHSKRRALAAGYLRLLAAAQEYHLALKGSYANSLEGLLEENLRLTGEFFQLKIDLAAEPEQQPDFVISVLSSDGQVLADCDSRTIRIYGPDGPARGLESQPAAIRGQQLVRAQKFFRYLAKAQADYLSLHGAYAIDLGKLNDPELLTAGAGFEISLELKTSFNNEPGFQATVRNPQGDIIDIYDSGFSQIYDRWL